jgi:hypothetical protein
MTKTAKAARGHATRQRWHVGCFMQGMKSRFDSLSVLMGLLILVALFSA